MNYLAASFSALSHPFSPKQKFSALAAVLVVGLTLIIQPPVWAQSENEPGPDDTALAKVNRVYLAYKPVVERRVQVATWDGSFWSASEPVADA
ncbi:MAG TPA: hypothetical protein PKZ53_28265, partial [Acidobacteriota bacterium]|nr:hypothetical protein [Acidobacteriota bacterium]